MSVLIALGGGIENVPVIQRAKALGHTVLVVDGRLAAPGMLTADVPVMASCYHTEQVLPALGYALKRSGLEPDGVICAGVDAPHVAAAIASAYRLPGLTPEAARLSVDKLAQKTALRAAGLPVPQFAELEEGGYLTLSSRNPDKVLKPVDSRGARGVQLLRFGRSQEFGAALAAAIKASSTGRVMVEEYLPGPQLSTESIVVDGRVLFTAVALRNYDRLDEYAPYCIEDGFLEPSPEHTLWEKNDLGWRLAKGRISDLLEKACSALGFYQSSAGVVKGDLIISNGEPVILELAARLSGGFLCLAHEWTYGVDFIGAAINMALGVPFSLQPKPVGYCAQCYIFPKLADIGRRVMRVPLMHRVVGELPISFATFAVRPGDVLRPVTDHGARLGQVIATGNTPEKARARAESAVVVMQKAIVLE